MNKYFLGIDTSNYTTSAAITDIDKNIVSDYRILLEVKKGNRGLRQQEALFQHNKNLPLVLQKCFGDIDRNEIAAVCVSDRPRNVNGSYMPCFLAGVSVSKILSSALDIPIYYSTHQEGHFRAAKAFTEFEDIDSCIFCHLSGGTCEIIDVEEESFKIEGGSLDISFGQLLDRTGVLMGFDFPCGKKLDEIALKNISYEKKFKDIKVNDGWFNLSGIETQISKSTLNDENIKELFEKITKCLAKALIQVCDKTGKKDILLAGGVSSSIYLRENIGNYFDDINISFGKPDLCSDNAVGISLLGGALWLQNR